MSASFGCCCIPVQGLFRWSGVVGHGVVWFGGAVGRGVFVDPFFKVLHQAAALVRLHLFAVAQQGDGGERGNVANVGKFVAERVNELVF